MRLIILGILLLSWSACSYLTEFYIYNDTFEEVRISYVIKSEQGYGAFSDAPRLFVFGKYNDLRAADELPGQINYVPADLAVVATLAPKQALYVGNAVNFDLETDHADLYTNLKFLSIQSPTDEIFLEGIEVTPYFEELDRHSRYVGIVLQP